MIMANEILVTIKKRKICATVNTNITTGSVDSVQCTFTYDEEWEQLAKTAIFKASNEKIYPIFLEGNTCNVPPEVLTEGECFGIGVMGAQGEWMVIPSTMVRVSLEKGCYTAPFPITKDVYLQIVTLFCEKTAELEEMTKKVEQAADEILGSIADIKEAEETVIEKAAQASNAAKEAEQHELKAQGYADDAQKSAQSAKDSEDNIKNMKTDIHADAETAAQKAAEAVAAAGEAGTARDKAKEYQDAAQASAADALASAQAAGESEENVTAIQSDVQRLAGQVSADKADVTKNTQTVTQLAQQVQETADGFQTVADEAKSAVTAEGTKQVGLVTAEGTKQIGLVSQEGEDQIAAVNTAGATQTANAQAQADRAEEEADRAEQEANRAASIDAYTKEESRQTFANAFVGEKSGAWVRMDDVCENTLLRKAAVQGVTTEVLANPEAEKSPDNIATISGIIPTTATVSGKNLINGDNVTRDRHIYPITVTAGEYIARCYNADLTQDGIKNGECYSVSFRDANEVQIVQWIHKGVTVTAEQAEKITEVIFYWSDAYYKGNSPTLKQQLERGLTPTSYEPFVRMDDYPLPSMEPLMSLENGVCDEYDAVSGVETRRIGKLTLNGTEEWATLPISSGAAQGKNRLYLNQYNWDAATVTDTSVKPNITSTHYLARSGWNVYLGQTGITITKLDDTRDVIFVFDNNYQDIDTWKAYLTAQSEAGTPVIVYYELKEPVTTQHDPQTIPVIVPTTTVFADDGKVSVSYNRDSNKVIEQITLDYIEQITALDARIAQLEIGG